MKDLIYWAILTMAKLWIVIMTVIFMLILLFTVTDALRLFIENFRL